MSILDVGAWLKKNIPHIARMDDPGSPQKKPDDSYMDVSENRDTPKWMVYNGKPY